MGKRMTRIEQPAPKPRGIKTDFSERDSLEQVVVFPLPPNLGYA